MARKKKEPKNAGRTMAWLPTLSGKRVITRGQAVLWAAEHEAAHVVVAQVAGVEVAYSEIYGPLNGYTVYTSPPWYQEAFVRPGMLRPPPLRTLTEEQRSYIYRRIAVSLAGEIAERRLAQRHGGAMRPDKHERDDIGVASTLALYLGAGNTALAQSICTQAEVRAEKILEQGWPLVEQIAARMVQKGRLDAGALQEFVSPLSRPAGP